MVIKADALRTIMDRRYDEASNLTVLKAASKMVSFETVVDVAKRLVSLHKAIKMDYRKRFGIEDSSPAYRGTARSGDDRRVKSYYCSKCKKTISEKVAKFCWNNEQRFGGRTYCFDCQKLVSK
jgi:hypothetical protein